MSELMRAQIVAEIMKLVRPEPVTLKHRPTIAELEALLNAEDEPDIPKGSALLGKKPDPTNGRDAPESSSTQRC